MDAGEAGRVEETPVRIPLGPAAGVEAALALPAGAGGVVVLFAVPGSGAAGGMAEDVSPALHGAGLGTLRVDAVADGAEAASGHEHRFDAGAMSDRLAAVVDWLARDARTRRLPVGCMATGTAAPAAVKAAVSRKGLRTLALLEGRPELAGAAVEALRVPTLLVVAGLDAPLLQANHRVLRRLRCPAMLEVVPGALHGLREADGRAMAVQRVADWFGTHLGTREPARGGTPPGGVAHPVILTP